MNYNNVTDLALNFGDGEDNPSGVAEIAYFIPLSWFAVNGLKKPTASTTAASLITISTAHVLAAGKYAIPVTPLFSKSGINWKMAGEELSKIMEIGADIFIPDNSVKSLGTVQAIKNYRGILLIGKADDSGHFWQIGSEKISCKVVGGDGGTGVGPTGEVGTKMSFQSHSSQPVFVYTAGVPIPAP
jgi:hypothetical protein